MADTIHALAALEAHWRNLNSRAISGLAFPVERSDADAVLVICNLFEQLIDAADWASRMHVRGDMAKGKQQLLREVLSKVRGMRGFDAPTLAGKEGA